MGFIFTPKDGDDDMGVQLYTKNDVLLDDAANDPSTPEQFETGVGKLALQEDGTAWPLFTNEFKPTIVLQEKGDYHIGVLNDAVDPATGHMKFQLYLGATLVEAPGNYRFNLSIKPN